MSAPVERSSATGIAARARPAYIVSPWYDWAFFLLPPVLALVVGACISGTPFAEAKFRLHGQKVTWAGLCIGILVHAHLVAVFLRSHGNPAVFRRHPARFLVAPLVLLAAMMTSLWVAVVATVLVVFWDVYHSALQTFGIARIYERNQGNDPTVGRRLDYWLNLLVYAGPILGGATMLAHFQSFEAFEAVDAAFFSAIPVFMEENHRTIALSLIGAGTLFLLFYIAAYLRMRRRGYRVSLLKVYLLATTGLCSLYTWGLNPWGQAFIIMNLFHAVQYLGLVWWSEGKGFMRTLRVDGLRAGKPIAVVVFLGVALGYGYWAELVPSDDRLLWSITQVVALMHFWYDGFIWSVTREQI